MSVSALWATDPPTDAGQVGTIKGWGDFGRWVESLPLNGHGALVQQWEHGGTDQLDSLPRQLQNALDRHPPKVSTVRSTAAKLLTLLQSRPKAAEGIVIHDGTEAE
jgi:hypothetical protein